MKPPVIVREFARLTTSTVDHPTLGEAQIAEVAFDWLCRESARLSPSGASLTQVENRRSLRLDNYVGVIEAPCGTRIEILPKTVEREEDIAEGRQLLRKMISRCLQLPVRESAPSSIQTFHEPLTEWVMREFLHTLDTLIKRGLRFDYHTVKAEQRFLRGRLDVVRQIRQPPSRMHLLHIEHDVFDPDRPENRLLATAVQRVAKATRDASNWRLANELATYLAPVPPSVNVAADFARWRNDRLLAHYRPVRPWCALILGEQTPMSMLGQWRGNSLLFPMEAVFERYVEVCMRRWLPSDATLKATPSTENLVQRHLHGPMFQLKPDFLLRQGNRTCILDTKWKLLDQNATGGQDKYDLKQSDFYQLFAYGKKYLHGEGDLYLVFPRSRHFKDALPVFEFSDTMRLWVVPFDLKREEPMLSDDCHPVCWGSEPVARAAS